MVLGVSLMSPFGSILYELLRSMVQGSLAWAEASRIRTIARLPTMDWAAGREVTVILAAIGPGGQKVSL